MKNLIIIFLVGLCFSLSAQDKTATWINAGLKKIGLPHVINYTSKKYKANPHNYAAIQDDNGIMYFGNLWGLLQFDGATWRMIRLPNGVSCTSLAKDDAGTIYVGGRNEIGYLSTDSLGGKCYVSLRNLVPGEARSFSEVWETVKTAGGILFISREALLFKPHGKNEIRLLKKNISKAFYADNRIFAFKQNMLSVFKNEGQGILEAQPPVLTQNIHYITSVDHKLMCVMDDGLAVLTEEIISPGTLP